MKTHSLFYKIYFSAVALFAVGLTVFLFAFGGWLKAYEAAQPEQIMSAFMNNDVKGGKISAVKDKYHISVSKYETNDSIDKAFTAATKGKELTFATSAIKPEGCDLAYSVKSGDSKLMSVYLKRDSKKRYSISGIDFDKKLYKSYKISATSDAEISVNGIIVEDGDRKNEELPDIDSTLTKSGSIINKQIISLDNMLNDEPQITAKSGSHGAAGREKRHGLQCSSGICGEGSGRKACRQGGERLRGIYAERFLNGADPQIYGHRHKVL